MITSDISKSVERCLDWEAQMDEAFPGCWDALDAARICESGKRPWPTWCVLPMAEVDKVLSADGDLPDEVLMQMVPNVAGLYAWRQGRTVHRVPPEVAAAFEAAGEALYDERADRLSLEAFFHLPGAGVYIAWPGSPAELHGGFVHVDWEPATGRPSLRLLIDLVPVPAMVALGLFLDHESLAEALEEAETGLSASIAGVSGPSSRGDDDELALIATHLAHPLLMATLYLCSPTADVTERAKGHGGVRVRDLGRSLIHKQGVMNTILQTIAVRRRGV